MDSSGVALGLPGSLADDHVIFSCEDLTITEPKGEFFCKRNLLNYLGPRISESMGLQKKISVDRESQGARNWFCGCRG